MNDSDYLKQKIAKDAIDFMADFLIAFIIIGLLCLPFILN